MLRVEHFLLVLIAADFSNAALFINRSNRNSCPQVVTKPEFDYRQYAGLWYETYKLPNVFQRGLQCVQAEYYEISEGVVSVFNIGTYASGGIGNITGSARALDENHPGFLIVSFPGRPDGTYLVLDTDYSVYSSVYSCTAVGPYVLEFAWILARQNTLTPEQTDLAFSKFEQFGINVTKFEQTYQSDNCDYQIPTELF